MTKSTRLGRVAALVLGLGLTITASACDKPSEDDCRRAIDNIKRLSGTDKMLDAESTAGWIRKCRGNSKRDTVQCAIGAQTREGLEKCGIPIEAPPPPGGSGSGSATP